MQIVNKWIAVFTVASTLAFAPMTRGQEVGAPQTPPKPQTVEVSPNGTQVKVGDKVQFTAVAKDASGKVMDVKQVIWIAGPFDLVGIDEKGVAVFHQPGEATLGAIIAGKAGFAHVTVATQPVTKVDVKSPADALVVGSTTLLWALPRAENGDPRSDVALQWKSNTPKIAMVDDSGTVTGLAPGQASIQVHAGQATGTVQIQVIADTVQKISVAPGSTTARTGDVVHFTATPEDGKGGTVKNILTNWSVSGRRATIYPDGGFVAQLAGTYQVTASVGQHSAVASIIVTPRNVEREIDVVAHIPVKGSDGEVIQTTEEWVMGNHLYVATLADRVFSYDVSDPAHPKQLDMLKADARLINDISTTPDEKMGVFTREEASNRKNGIVLFDASDAAHLKVLSEFTETVTGGVHSAFINTHYAYITDDATGSLRVIDFQDPAHPKQVARWQTENSTATTVVGPLGPTETGRYLHDLYVKDGLAYLAYWRDGFIILDVGAGIKGGSPEHPQLVAQYKYNHYELYGNNWLAGTHSAFRYKNYVFIGDEVWPPFFQIESKDRIAVRGICHVMDVSDIEHPREVANYEVPEGGVHNFWADNDMLFLGDYSGGGRVVDISGELRGNLYLEGREIARLWTATPEGFRPNLPFAWGAQPANGLIYINDINTGIWITKLGKPVFKGSTTAPPLQETADTP